MIINKLRGGWDVKTGSEGECVYLPWNCNNCNAATLGIVKKQTLLYACFVRQFSATNF